MKQKAKKIMVIGANGFIGCHLIERLLSMGRYEIYGLDKDVYRISHLLGKSAFFFKEGNIYDNWNWIEDHISMCDIVIPLAAIALPKLYIQEPLKVFELDFECNLKIIRMVVKHKKYLIFPSTSEVYGKTDTDYFYEDTTDIVVGPITHTRWIYSSIKQLLDRLIHAYHIKEELKYCCFRPFNWIGPKLDSIHEAQNGNSRVVTSFITNLLYKKPIKIVGDGKQSRCFTDIYDGVECLIRIIKNIDVCNNQIFNIGNPHNFLSIYELAVKCINVFKKHPAIPDEIKTCATYEFVSPDDYYGKGYEDIFYRRPSIEKANAILEWTPKINLTQSLEECITYLFFEWKRINEQ